MKKRRKLDAGREINERAHELENRTVNHKSEFSNHSGHTMNEHNTCTNNSKVTCMFCETG